MSESTRGPERIVVVGAGECGTRAAMALRERGFTGEITLLGREEVIAYELSLIHISEPTRPAA